MIWIFVGVVVILLSIFVLVLFGAGKLKDEEKIIDEHINKQ